MTNVLIKRELLERLACEVIPKTHQEMLDASEDFGAAIKELRAILAAPRQPEGDWGWLVNLELAEVQCNCPWNPDSHDPSCPVYLRDRLSDAQRAITELRDRLDVMTQCADNYSRMFEESAEECERLRVKLMTIASAEPGRHNIEWAKAMAATGNNEAYAKWREAFDQRDKLAELLADVKADYTHAIHWEDLHATMKRIDAALAEVDK